MTPLLRLFPDINHLFILFLDMEVLARPFYGMLF